MFKRWQDSFVSQVQNVNLSGKFLIFYDIASLFTYIPLQTTNDIAISLIFNSNLSITKR